MARDVFTHGQSTAVVKSLICTARDVFTHGQSSAVVKSLICTARDAFTHCQSTTVVKSLIFCTARDVFTHCQSTTVVKSLIFCTARDVFTHCQSTTVVKSLIFCTARDVFTHCQSTAVVKSLIFCTARDAFTHCQSTAVVKSLIFCTARDVFTHCQSTTVVKSLIFCTLSQPCVASLAVQTVQHKAQVMVKQLLLLVGCLTSQQHASVSQGRTCSDHFTCCHTETEVADQTFHLTQSQYTDTGPTGPNTDPITPGAWQDSHWSANFYVIGITPPRKNSFASGIRTWDLPLSRRKP